jgi:hypothetical protein
MVRNNIVIEGTRIGFRNFSGKEGNYNAAGKRNFCIFLEQDLARKLEEDGWNVRWLKPRDEQDDEQGYMSVEVSFKNKPPKIIMISHNGKRNIDEESIHILDWAEIADVDLIINPYNWEVSNKRGVKAYLKSMYITLVEDEFERKYYDVPDSADNAMCENCGTVENSCAKCNRSDGD